MSSLHVDSRESMTVLAWSCEKSLPMSSVPRKNQNLYKFRDIYAEYQDVINTSNTFEQWERKHPRYDLSGHLQVWKLPFPCLKETNSIHLSVSISTFIHPNSSPPIYLNRDPLMRLSFSYPPPKFNSSQKPWLFEDEISFWDILACFQGRAVQIQGSVWDLYNPKKTMNYEPRSFTAWWLGSFDGAVKLPDDVVGVFFQHSFFWNILATVKLDHLSGIGVNIKNIWNHQLVK